MHCWLGHLLFLSKCPSFRITCIALTLQYLLISSNDSQVKTQPLLWIFILFNIYPANVENRVSS
jgi:hypothetical protein